MGNPLHAATCAPKLIGLLPTFEMFLESFRLQFPVIACIIISLLFWSCLKNATLLYPATLARAHVGRSRVLHTARLAGALCVMIANPHAMLCTDQLVLMAFPTPVSVCLYYRDMRAKLV